MENSAHSYTEGSDAFEDKSRKEFEKQERIRNAAPFLLEALIEVDNRYSSLMTEKMRNKIRNAIRKTLPTKP